VGASRNLTGEELVLQVCPWHEAAGRYLRVGQRHFPGHSAFGHFAEALDDEGQFLRSSGDDGGLAIGFSVGKEQAVDGGFLQVIVIRPIEVVRIRACRAAAASSMRSFGKP
ncbi:uncharacterized protein METZ01_LOCUS394072, partial [marine metagenome]